MFSLLRLYSSFASPTPCGKHAFQRSSPSTRTIATVFARKLLFTAGKRSTWARSRAPWRRNTSRTCSRTSGSSTQMKSQCCALAPLGAQRPASRMRSSVSRGTSRPGSNFRTLRRAFTTSSRLGYASAAIAGASVDMPDMVVLLVSVDDRHRGQHAELLQEPQAVGVGADLGDDPVVEPEDGHALLRHVAPGRALAEVGVLVAAACGPAHGDAIAVHEDVVELVAPVGERVVVELHDEPEPLASSGDAGLRERDL